jgi:hypothetical protein
MPDVMSICRGVSRRAVDCEEVCRKQKADVLVVVVGVGVGVA